MLHSDVEGYIVKNFGCYATESPAQEKGDKYYLLSTDDGLVINDIKSISGKTMNSHENLSVVVKQSFQNLNMIIEDLREPSEKLTRSISETCSFAFSISSA